MKKLVISFLVVFSQVIFSQESVSEIKLNNISFTSTSNYDTSNSSINDTSVTNYNADVKTILLETFLSPFMGIMFSFPSVICIAMKAWSGNVGEYDYLAIYLSFVLGTSTCIYMLADDFNPLTSFWGILTSGIVGAGIGTAIIESNGDQDLNGWEATAVISLPIICSVVYSNLINPKPEFQNAHSSKYSDFIPTYYSYKDIYNSTLIFKTEIFRFNF